MAKYDIQYADKPVKVQSTAVYARPQTAEYEALAKVGQSIFQIGSELQQRKDALEYSEGQRRIETAANAALNSITGDEKSDEEVWNKFQQDIGDMEASNNRVDAALTEYRNKAMPGIQQSLHNRYQELVRINSHDRFEALGQEYLVNGDLKGYQDLLELRLTTKDISRAEFDALSGSALSDSVLQQTRNLISNGTPADINEAIGILEDTKVIPGLDFSTDQKEYRNKLLVAAKKQSKLQIETYAQQYWQLLKDGNFTEIEKSLNDPQNGLPVAGEGGKQWWYKLLQSREEDLNQTDLTEQAKVADEIIFNPSAVTKQQIRNRAPLGIHGGLSLDKVQEYEKKLDMVVDKDSPLNSSIAKTFFNELKNAKQDRVFSVEQGQNEIRYGQSLDALSDYFIQYREKLGKDPSLEEAENYYNTLTSGYRSAQQPFTEAKIQQTLGELQSGGATTLFGTVIPFNKPEDAINHIIRNLGPNWQKIAPDAAVIIKQKWPNADITVSHPVVAKETFEVGDEQIYNGDKYRREADGKWHKVK